MSPFSRRDLLRAAGLSLVGSSVSGWFPAWADEVAVDPARRRHCVLLWMTGGPSQLDTFDMKPGHANGGTFSEIETSSPGLKFSEHLPKLATLAEHLVPIRGLTSKEGDHARGMFVARTGYSPNSPVRYPAIGASLAKELGSAEAELPNYVSVSPYEVLNRAAFSPGFLGPRYAALTVGSNGGPAPMPNGAADQSYAELSVDDLRAAGGVGQSQAEARLALWQRLETRFLGSHRTASPIAHETIYQRAVRMMQSEAAKAFNLNEEPDEVREAYGKGRFGQGCLLARRLIERGVPCVEVALGSAADGGLVWDTHVDNFATVKRLSQELDAGWGTLMTDLRDRGLLESTTFLWIGEFGRTPVITPQGGRDHFPNAWTCVLAGGGLKGGQAYGKTTADGNEVEEGKVELADVLATLCKAVGVEPDTQNVSELGRPIYIAEGKPIVEILA